MSPAAQKPLSMVVYTTKFGRHFDAIIASNTRAPPARSPEEKKRSSEKEVVEGEAPPARSPASTCALSSVE